MWFNKKFEVRRESIFNFADKENTIHEFTKMVEKESTDDLIHWRKIDNSEILRKPFILEIKTWF